MPSRSSTLQPSSPERAFWRRWLSGRPYALAAIAAAVGVAVLVGIQLGNSAIADINPIHYRGAVVHPRDRGAAVPEHQPRSRQPTYAALYGWDEGRAAQEAERARNEQAFTPPPPPVLPHRQDAAMQAWREPEAPRDFRVTIHRGKDGVDRYTVQGRADRVRDRDRRGDDLPRAAYRGQDYRSGDVYLTRDGEPDPGAADEPAAED